MKLICKSDGRVSTFQEVDKELRGVLGPKHTYLWTNLVQYMLSEKVASFVDAAAGLCPNWDLYDESAAWLDTYYTLEV